MISAIPYEFHVSRTARDRYKFDNSLFTTDGRVIFADFNAARLFAQKINSQRDLTSFPEQVVYAGEINALALIDEIFHSILLNYWQTNNPNLFSLLSEWLINQLGPQVVENTLQKFILEFPPVAVYNNELSVDEYLEGYSLVAGGDQIPNKQIALEEMIMLWLVNANPAAKPYNDLFNDADLRRTTAYENIINEVHEFFEDQPRIGDENYNLLEFMQSPFKSVPGSLIGQLEYIRIHWDKYISNFVLRILSGTDLIREETKPIYPPGEHGPSYVPEFFVREAEGDIEYQQFSPDTDWMPNLVLIAKNSFVWLDQLSKKYQRPINKLDEIPDEELDALRKWGITGIWLIGVWERSPASARIKQMRGNPEAIASAYSIYSYEISPDLGGEEAFLNLKSRAWERGIRLGSDMVPNHMGIDSKWVIEHPNWFISLDNPPFPSYSYNSANLSWDARVGIYIEDHYYNNSDAAVVFKRTDFWTGSNQFIYHGNDGTSMPWNDTAQLNYLIPEVREAVIQTILHVARLFPIIRFDAAMTLAKKHYQRLWFPEPGSGGDIPSRAGLGLTKEQFDTLFPIEFWREVVDRVAQEVPDTLLLAEAFWLMEGYFVRTLGMHRVYNSAFMNMLRDEKNQEYRLVIRNTIEFEPQILKRYVNFMNNPDERTAIDQFGKGDKYFGICTLLATFPGLPMLGHGQVEGFTEKYGMEYMRAYWDEYPDQDLILRHEKEIFPLFRRRSLFAEVQNFYLYDFYTAEGTVDEDVLAFSNRNGDDCALIIYHNRYKSTHGWIHTSAAYAEFTGEERIMVQKTLVENFSIPFEPDLYVIFKDVSTGLEFIRNCADIHRNGLHISLDAYRYHVFLDFRIVQETNDSPYHLLVEQLKEHGTTSINQALLELKLATLLTPFREIMNASYINWLTTNLIPENRNILINTSESIKDYRTKLFSFYSAVAEWLKINDEVIIDEETISDLSKVNSELLEILFGLARDTTSENPVNSEEILQTSTFLYEGPVQHTGFKNIEPGVLITAIGYLSIRSLGHLQDDQLEIAQSIQWVKDWMLGLQIVRLLNETGSDEQAAKRSINLIYLLLTWDGIYEPKTALLELFSNWFKDELKQEYLYEFLNINQYKDIIWFNKENFEELVWWLSIHVTLSGLHRTTYDSTFDLQAYQSELSTFIKKILISIEKSEYQLDNYLNLMSVRN
jgi:glycosidase